MIGHAASGVEPGEIPAALLVRRLHATDRAAILDHLLALNADDRYGRFASALSDHAIAAYVRSLALDRDAGFGIAGATGQLSGFIHLAIHGTTGEIGASVLPASRRCGQARQLFAAAFRHAGRVDISHIHLATGHPAAIRIGHSLACRVERRASAPRAIIFLAQELRVTTQQSI